MMTSSILFGAISTLILVISLDSVKGQQLQAKFEPNKFFPSSTHFDASKKSQNAKNDPSRPWRLPQNIKPSHYDLVIFPILNETVPGLGTEWTVPGHVEIHLAPTESTTRKIVLHAKNMQIINGETTLHKVLENDTQIPIPISFPVYNESRTELTVDSYQDLEVNSKYILSIRFISQIQEEFHGMYRSNYVNPQNETKWIAITQMEAVNARELFPCFDEPGFKATFSTKIGRNDDHVALTNGPSINVEPLDDIPGWSLETFGITVPMSTYLFAAVISDYGYSEANPAILPGTVVRTYAPQHQIDRQAGVYPSEKGAQLLKDFETRFGQEYPLAKMDQAAVTDFTFGAMENYGLNIYRASALLFYPDEGTEAERGSITQILAHELAHQWFGNLVSPAWWTHIWLNEGMSTYVQFLGMDAVVPEFRNLDLVINQAFQAALFVDANPNRTHSLKIAEDDWATKDPMSWFDTIAYEKGASIARMMEGFLGAQEFNDGLKTYQENRHHESAVQDDLFAALEQHAGNKLPFGMNLSTVMDGWTHQSGFPLLSVKSSGNRISIHQTKYRHPFVAESWVIPISVASSSNPNFAPQPEYWLKDENIFITETADKWVIINAGLTGYYRVDYDAPLEALILAQLRQNVSAIHSHSRSQLIDDYFTFAHDSLFGIVRALGFTNYMSVQAETEMVVWTPLFKHLEFYLNTFGSAGMLEDMKAYLLPRVKSAINANGGMDKITLTSKGMEVLSHTQLLDWACALEDAECINYAATSVDAWRSNISANPIAHDLKPVLYCAAAGKERSYGEFMIDEYKDLGNGLSPKQRQLLFQAFQCINDEELIVSMLTDTLTTNLFHTKSDAAVFLRNLASNNKMRNQLVSFMRRNTSEIMTSFAPNGVSGVLLPLVASLSNFMSSEEDLAEIVGYIADNQEIFQGSLDQYPAIIQSNIDRIEKYGVPMQQYFKDNSGGSGGDTGSAATYRFSFLTFVFAIVARLVVKVY